MLALEGIKVVEFCEIAAGPFCAMLLADMGADVIKVERPAGDAMRSWPPVNEGYSENFASINRNKRSVVLDLKTPEGLHAAKAIILDSDVVVENFRPGVLARLGIDYASMSAEKPGLIYCSISAFGQEGPRAKQGGFDLTMQAMSGIMSITGEPGGDPIKCGLPLCDFVAALYGAFAVTAALRQREITGKGQNLDVSMLGTSLGVAALQTSEYFGTGRDPRKLGSAHPRNAPYQAFRAKDGHFGMAAGNNSLWHQVCNVVALPELKDDERYLTPSLRAQNQNELRETLEAVFETKDVAHCRGRGALQPNQQLLGSADRSAGGLHGLGPGDHAAERQGHQDLRFAAAHQRRDPADRRQSTGLGRAHRGGLGQARRRQPQHAGNVGLALWKRRLRLSRCYGSNGRMACWP